MWSGTAAAAGDGVCGDRRCVEKGGAVCGEGRSGVWRRGAVSGEARSGVGPWLSSCRGAGTGGHRSARRSPAPPGGVAVGAAARSLGRNKLGEKRSVQEKYT